MMCLDELLDAVHGWPEYDVSCTNGLNTMCSVLLGIPREVK